MDAVPISHLKTRKDSRKFRFNEFFFDKIDSEEKAYILGLFFADGCNHFEKKSFSISLQAKDRDMIVKIKDILQSEYRIYESNPKPSKYILNPQKQYTFRVTSEHLCKKLALLGCGPRKSLVLKFPSPEHVPSNLTHHFMRGYFDGDGSIVVSSVHGKYKKGYLSIVSTKEFIDGFYNVIEKELGFRHSGFHQNSLYSKRFKDLSKNSYVSYLCGNQRILKVYSFLYKDATLFLQRKRDKFEIIVGHRHEKRKPVVATNIVTNVSIKYPSVNAAALDTGVNFHIIRRHCYHRRTNQAAPTSINNLIFSFLHEEDIYNRMGRNGKEKDVEKMSVYFPIKTCLPTLAK